MYFKYSEESISKINADINITVILAKIFFTDSISAATFIPSPYLCLLISVYRVKALK